MANSEVARLLQQIDMEYESAQRGLEGLAVTARRDFITARMERIAQHHRSLAQLMAIDEVRTLILEQSAQEKEEQ